MTRFQAIRRTMGGLAALATSLVAAGAEEPAPRPHADYTETIPGSDVRFPMVAIPGGTFAIGSPPGEPGRRDHEGPRRPLKIRPFWMGKLEVTWDEYGEFRKVIGSNRKNAEALAKDADAVTHPTAPYPDETFGYGRKGRPAILMSHHAAMEYCYWLSRKTGKAYRLPTEAEWEYACRAGTETAYSFGDDPKKLDDYSWFFGNAEKPMPVGKKKPNPWGLFDMHGNVAEWCLDRYAADAYAGLPQDRPAVGPVLLPTAALYPHVARGGSWDDDAPKCRSAARRGSEPKWNEMDPDGSIWWVWDAPFVGFRVVRAVEEQEDLEGLRSQVRKPAR
ncbi:formylglycine-generating enzyme family protein [Paludisphaera soli]|uniref:formylglycine-generating enzyme family protein n=1 Tax=Paludisphaera soli TaxID=2712865 RepID=UPI0013EC6E23|nr:formylglycine-generating enzyme family protein [Paludisphaera soli]